MNSAERSLAKALDGKLKGVTPGLRVQVHKRGRRVIDLALGKNYLRYDLASLTKLIFSTSVLMRKVPQNFQLDRPLFLSHPWIRSRSLTARRCLMHHSGLKWWEPFYKKLNLDRPRLTRWMQLRRWLCPAPVRRKKHAVYSDPDLLVLGYEVERLYGQELLQVWRSFQVAMELESIDFHPDNRPPYPLSDYAPTEDCPWRGKILRGEVHDENCWALGGVAPHAGLFGNINDVSKWALQMRLAHRGESEEFWQPQVVRNFTRRAMPRQVGDWGLGFMKPTRGGASCGRNFSDQSFGHTGFTGTSVWSDPKADLVVVILSNRVHPTRENRSFLQLRPFIHDQICEVLR